MFRNLHAVDLSPNSKAEKQKMQLNIFLRQNQTFINIFKYQKTISMENNFFFQS